MTRRAPGSILLRRPTRSSEAVLLRNDGNGSWQPLPADLPPDVPGPRVAALADIGGDGIVDIVAANGYFGGSLWQNDGAGGFVAAHAGALATWTAETRAIATGDVDGDGDPDVITASYTPGGSQLYKNVGGTLYRDFTFPQPVAWSVALGDIDGDGDLDAYFGWGPGDVVVKNDGTGTFTTATGATNGSTFAHHIYLVDLDGDSDLDLAAPNQRLANNGTGAFTPFASQRLGGDLLAVAARGLAMAGASPDPRAWYAAARSVGAASHRLRRLRRERPRDVHCAGAEPSGHRWLVALPASAVVRTSASRQPRDRNAARELKCC